MFTTSLTFHRVAIAAGVVSASAAFTPASAAPSDALDPFSISIGAYIVNPSANVSVNTPYGSASTGDVSSHEVQVPRLKADFLLGDRQGFALDYYGFNRQYSDTLNRSFAAGDSEVNFTGNIHANVGLDLANASYRWWFGQGADVIGVGVGAAYYRIRFGVDGFAATNIDNASGYANAHYSASTFAPLVQLGWRHAFSPHARLYVDLSGIEKSGGNLNGHIYNAAIGGEWYFAKKIGVGVEYSATRVKIRVDGNNERLDLRMNGPTVFLKARF
ncbi:MAG: hypothetical protein V4627_11905 [Pseudomonadota bacterium]